MSKALGIILAGGSASNMKELTYKRAVAAIRVAGTFRAIDFALSNMTNSGIKTVAVLTQYNARSLNEHLASSKWWNFGRKKGGLFVFTPTVTPKNSWWYRGTADSIYQNIDWIKGRREEYVVIAPGDGVCKMDYGKMIDYHIKKGADITVAYTETDEDPKRFGVIKLNEDDRIVEFEEKPMLPMSNTISIGVYVISRKLLIELIEKTAAEERHDFVNDILLRYKNFKKLYGYKINTYWSNVSTIEAYFKTNMDFLKKDVRQHFFREDPLIYSKVTDVPPAKYNPGSKVSNSLISGGDIINGEVSDSIIFKNVFIGKNAWIKNSIVMNDVHIGDNAVLENCIVENFCTVDAGTVCRGENEIKVIVGRPN